MNGSNPEPPDRRRSDPGGQELAPVSDAERWQRIVDLAVAHEGESDRAAGDPDDSAGG